MHRDDNLAELSNGQWDKYYRYDCIVCTQLWILEIYLKLSFMHLPAFTINSAFGIIFFIDIINIKSIDHE